MNIALIIKEEQNAGHGLNRRNLMYNRFKIRWLIREIHTDEITDQLLVQNVYSLKQALMVSSGMTGIKLRPISGS